MPDQEPITRAADKAGVVGAIVAAMGCAACFPALGSLAAALGLGFLSQYEGVFIRYLLPLFAVIALTANVAGGMRHRRWSRMILGMVGPLLVLAAGLTPLPKDPWWHDSQFIGHFQELAVRLRGLLPPDFASHFSFE